MEILPNLWIGYYDDIDIIQVIKNNKIKSIVHLSNKHDFFKKKDCDEIRADIDYTQEDSLEIKNNIVYRCLFHVTDYIHENIINTDKVLLIGESNRQDLDVMVIAYLVRFGKLTIYDSIQFFKTKKDTLFEPKCNFFGSLNKFYNHLYT